MVGISIVRAEYTTSMTAARWRWVDRVMSHGGINYVSDLLENTPSAGRCNSMKRLKRDELQDFVQHQSS